MQYRIDTKTENKLSALGFGCMRFPGPIGMVNQEKTEELILKAYEEGINYYDTAYIYPGSEEALGNVLVKHNLREKVYVATKLPHSKCTSYEDFDRLFETQLQRLKTDYIDYYLIHQLGHFSHWQRLLDLGIEKWISEKKASGAIKQIGFSFHGTCEEFIKIVDAYPWEFTQIQYNYSNPDFQAGIKGLKYAHSKGLPVIIMEPLLGGKLASPSKDIRQLFEKSKPGSTPPDWAFRWLWNHKEITVVLSGMNEMNQLNENIKTVCDATVNNMSADELQIIEKATQIFRKKDKTPCTGCGYCLPCPKGINIPGCFSSYNLSYSTGFVTGVFNYFTTVGINGTPPQYASTCIGCGACEKKCPQGIKIRDELKRVKRRLQIPGTSIANRVMRTKKI